MCRQVSVCHRRHSPFAVYIAGSVAGLARGVTANASTNATPPSDNARRNVSSSVSRRKADNADTDDKRTRVVFQRRFTSGV
jgi:hypothetical protein